MWRVPASPSLTTWPWGRSHSGLLYWKVADSGQVVWERRSGQRMHSQPEIESSFFILPGLNRFSGSFGQGLLSSHPPRVSNDSLRKQLLALGSKGKCPQLASQGKSCSGSGEEEGLWGLPVLGDKSFGRSSGSHLLQQNGRRAQPFCQLTESNHGIFNFYYEKWKHAQIITGTLIYQSPSGNAN